MLCFHGNFSNITMLLQNSNNCRVEMSHHRYGYIDPKGEVREFTYKSGIPCDPKTKQPLNQDPTEKPRRNKKGYFDYSDNKFVLPNGKRVTVVVNKANRARG